MEQTNFFKILDEVFRGDISTPNPLLDTYNQKLIRGENLSPAEAREAVQIIMSDTASDYQKGQFLTALKVKQPTVREIAAFAEILREMAIPVQIRVADGRSVLGDTCGTGGGTVETFNVSTAIMFILAAAGMVIAKHGNRAITSKCGSADVLEALGVRIDLPPDRVGECISEIGVGFIFAPNFHKAFKNIQPVRKRLPFPTVFNMLGPLVNPAFKSNAGRYVQVLGANRQELTETMAEVLRLLKSKRAMVVHGFNADGSQGLDELSTVGKTKVSELKGDSSVENYFITPGQFGIKRAEAKDLKGGTPQENAAIIRDILGGKQTGPKLDIVLLNAAAGLYVGGIAKNLEEGIVLARSIIKDGCALVKLEQLVRFTSS